MFSVVFMLGYLRCCATDYLDRAGHPHVAVAGNMAAPAADAGHGELALDKVVGQFAEETAVAAVVDRLARVVTTRHPGEAGQRAGVPHPDAFDFVFPHFPVGDREAGTGRADVGAGPAFEAAVAD